MEPGCDFIIPGKIDRGGAINLISPRNIMSKNCPGRPPVAIWWKWKKSLQLKWKNGEESIPMPLIGEYDPASGLRFRCLD